MYVGAIQELGETGVAMATLESLDACSYDMHEDTYDLISGNSCAYIFHHCFSEGVESITSRHHRCVFHLAISPHLCYCWRHKAQ